MTDETKRRRDADRRRYPNRRSGLDRRLDEQQAAPSERRKGDRRSWVERRGRKPS